WNSSLALKFKTPARLRLLT
ncbi:sensor TorS domain protein, partial [Vibrio parahaemolyticus EKP-028]